MEKEPGLLAQAALLVAALVGLYGVTVLVFSLDNPPAPQAPAVTGTKPAALFSFPLDYSASVTQSGNGITEPRTRFYSAPSKREGK